MNSKQLSIICVVGVLAGLACNAPEAPDDDIFEDIPTTGRVDIEAWLAQRKYKAWQCQPKPHPSVAPSPHGFNRVCMNRIAASAKAGEFPVGAGLVKEFFDMELNIIGYSTERHTRAGTDGSTWYWYERVPLSFNDPTMPHDEFGVIADGWGFDSPAKAICVKCHETAGREGHTGHDFVFTAP